MTNNVSVSELRERAEEYIAARDAFENRDPRITPVDRAEYNPLYKRYCEAGRLYQSALTPARVVALCEG